MDRCVICGWTLAKDQAFGCVPGDCAYRPDDPQEQRRLRERRDMVKRATDALMEGWQECGDVPFPLYGHEAREITERVIRAIEMPQPATVT